jgi:hypothetical protein
VIPSNGSWPPRRVLLLRLVGLCCCMELLARDQCCALLQKAAQLSELTRAQEELLQKYNRQCEETDK